MRLLSFFLFLLLTACQDASTKKTKAANKQAPQVIQETSPRARFEQFIAQFPHLTLPYNSSGINNFERLDDHSIERVLGVEKDPELGLKQSVNCIGTFKVQELIAVLYQSIERPNTEFSPTYFTLALYTPYGALKKEIILGKNQQTDDFMESIKVLISKDFKIQVEHYIDHYVAVDQALNTYISFYVDAFQINGSDIQTTKPVALWEKIPEEFVAPFVFEHKKMPSSSTFSIQEEASKTILYSEAKGFNQVIVQEIMDSLIFVSSLEMEQIKTNEDSFYVNSKAAIIQLKDKHLILHNSKLFPEFVGSNVYAEIQKNCNCIPAPESNSTDFTNLTTLETPLQNAVFIDFNAQQTTLDFICNYAGKNADSSFYSMPINR